MIAEISRMELDPLRDVLVIKLGTQEHPATQEEMESAAIGVTQALEARRIPFIITDHRAQFSVISGEVTQYGSTTDTHREAGDETPRRGNDL